MLSYLLIAIVVLASLSFDVDAAQGKRRVPRPEPTAQQRLSEYCRANDLGWIETQQQRAEYHKECAPRPGRVQRFWEIVDEMEKRKTDYQKAWKAIVADPKNRRKHLTEEIAGVKQATSRDTMRGMYQCLYELERREVFNLDGTKRMRAVLERDGAKIGRLTVRQRFAREFIHRGIQESDGYDALSDQAHKADRAYEEALAKRGLVADCRY